MLAASPEELFKPLAKLGVPNDVHSVRSVYLRRDRGFLDAWGV